MIEEDNQGRFNLVEFMNTIYLLIMVCRMSTINLCRLKKGHSSKFPDGYNSYTKRAGECNDQNLTVTVVDLLTVL